MQPCGGAIPLCMVDEFSLPQEIIDRKVTKMKMISPSNREVDVGKTLSETEYIGMCRREVLDSYLRKRAVDLGAKAINALVMRVEQACPPTFQSLPPISSGGRKVQIWLQVRELHLCSISLEVLYFHPTGSVVFIHVLPNVQQGCNSSSWSCALRMGRKAPSCCTTTTTRMAAAKSASLRS